GVSENEMVMLILPSGSEFIASVYGLASIGGIALPVNSRLTQYELETVLEDSKPAGLISTEKIYNSYKNLFRKDANLRFAISIDDKFEENNKEIKYYTLNNFREERSPLTPPSGNPVITCHYTYRGCGFPLGVPHRYHDYSTYLDGMENRFPVTSGSAVIIGLPIYPIYGLMILVLYPLGIGLRLVFVSKFMEKNFLEVYEKHNAMGTCLVPVIMPKFLSELKARGSKDKINLNANLLIASSATTLHENLHRDIAEASGIEIIIGYGFTEGLTITSTYKGLKSARGTLGVPLHDDIQVKIVDTSGDEVPDGTLGEIIVSGPTITEGYLNKPEVNKKFFKDGFFYTGDLGYKDENGYLVFQGRALPIAKVAAQMVDLIEVENIVRRHPDVLKVKATEKKVPVGRNYVILTVIIKQSSAITQQELQAFCMKYLSYHKIPAEIRFQYEKVEEMVI
ncbi:MAG: class I adenylate-forming enzyme family protein, partial [Bacteroidota bacterium]